MRSCAGRIRRTSTSIQTFRSRGVPLYRSVCLPSALASITRSLVLLVAPRPLLAAHSAAASEDIGPNDRYCPTIPSQRAPGAPSYRVNARARFRLSLSVLFETPGRPDLGGAAQ